MNSRTPSGVRALQSRSYAELEVVAANVRSRLKCSDDEAINGLKFFDLINSIEVEMLDGSMAQIETGIENLGDGREGLSRYNNEKGILEVILAPNTYSALELGNPRATYCVVHEFSHAILHAEQLRQLAQLPQPGQIAFHRGTSRPHPMYLDTEWQANALAAALLMPARGLSNLERRFGWLAPDMIKRQYAVSAKAAEIRCKLFAERKEALLKNR